MSQHALSLSLFCSLEGPLEHLYMPADSHLVKHILNISIDHFTRHLSFDIQCDRSYTNSGRKGKPLITYDKLLPKRETVSGCECNIIIPHM